VSSRIKPSETGFEKTKHGGTGVSGQVRCFFLRCYLNPERNDFLEGDAPAATKVEAFLARALETVGGDADITAGALVPWICDALLSNHSVKAYGRDLMDFLRHMQAQGVAPLAVTADHVKLYKRALLQGLRTTFPWVFWAFHGKYKIFI